MIAPRLLSVPLQAFQPVQIAEWREQLGVGEDVYPLDGGMSVAEFAFGGRSDPIPRAEWSKLRALRGSAVR